MDEAISRRELIRKLRALGFDGPFPGGRHEFVRRGPVRIPIPGRHRGDIPAGLLRRILREAGISLEEWEKA
ncbi:MAG: type II toxin-antitoxin system HicA family toxin [Dehalococcoidia bacterium]|nr:type II toxin-antitoxin system HicA family toxin [Dehalococcoidia bacterium]